MIKEVYAKGNAYMLELPDRWKIHLVTSAEHLEPASAPNSESQTRSSVQHRTHLPAKDDGDHSDQWASRKTNPPPHQTRRTLPQRGTECVVQWKGYRLEYNEWVKENDIGEFEDSSIRNYKRTSEDLSVRRRMKWKSVTA